jgi:hypothetical protein
MKNISIAICGAVVILLTGCVTKVQRIDLTGDIMIDAPHAIAVGPPRDRVLWEDRWALACMRHGDFAQAKTQLDDVLRTLGGIYGKDPDAKKSRSYFVSENKKTFIGEPYERVMAYYYRGILYWMDGEPDNARACFRTGQIEDSSSEGEQYNADYVLLDYLDGLASTKLGQDGSDAFKRSQSLAKADVPPAYGADDNVLCFFDFGPGPRKYAEGHYREELHFSVPPSRVHSVEIDVDGQSVRVGHYDDLGFQATTRGGRVMDHVLANKAVFKSTTDVVGNTAIIGGAIAASSRNQTSEEVGAGLIVAGIVSKIVSAETTPAADTRTWDNLPRYLSFAELHLPAGPHTATVQFYGSSGELLADLTKTVNFTVPADKHDKVIYVSDRSTSNLSL